MALRTSEAAVRRIITTKLSTADVQTFMLDAALWVDEELAPKGLSVGRLEMIERYLTAALIRLKDLGLRSARFGGELDEVYQVDDTVSDYLLRAASFDSTGTVQAVFLRPKARKIASGTVGRGFRDDVTEE